MVNGYNGVHEAAVCGGCWWLAAAPGSAASICQLQLRWAVSPPGNCASSITGQLWEDVGHANCQLRGTLPSDIVVPFSSVLLCFQFSNQFVKQESNNKMEVALHSFGSQFKPYPSR